MASGFVRSKTAVKRNSVIAEENFLLHEHEHPSFLAGNVIYGTHFQYCNRLSFSS
jgi:hypothetical protein